MMMIGTTIKRIGAVINLCYWCFIFVCLCQNVDILQAVNSMLFLPVAHCFTLQVFLHLGRTNTWLHKFLLFHLLQILAYVGSSVHRGAETKTSN